MSKVCNNCGRSVEENHKFCPGCGTPIESKIENKVLVCENCGSENSINDSFCSECGVKLNDKTSKEVISKTSHQQKRSTEKPSYKKQKNKKPKKAQHQTNINEEKSLNRGKLLGIVGAAVGLIIILLYAEGVFDRPVTPTTNIQQTSGPQVNLANIQKINELDAQVKANPNNYELLLQLAHLRNDSGFYEQAINDYQTYLVKNTNNVDARIDMGVCYFNLKNFPKAIEEMERAIKINPTHQIGLLNLGIVNLSAGNLEKSKEWLKKSININPNSDIGKRATELLNSHLQIN